MEEGSIHYPSSGLMPATEAPRYRDPAEPHQLHYACLAHHGHHLQCTILCTRLLNLTVSFVSMPT